MALNWSWTAQQHKDWAAKHAKGRNYFLVRNGILMWGGSMFLVMACGPALFGIPFRVSPTLWYWTWQTALWMGAGMLYGMFVWHMSERLYFEHLPKGE